MTASQMRIAETIDAFYGDAGANDGVSRSYKQAVEDLDAETIKALDGPFRYAKGSRDVKSEGGSWRATAHTRVLGKPSWNRSHDFAPTSLISMNVGSSFSPPPPLPYSSSSSSHLRSTSSHRGTVTHAPA